MSGMTRTGIAYADFAWNPAPGCSKQCPGCWARQFARRAKCPLCREFTPHWHPERRWQPVDTKKPGVVVVNFMGELWDPADTDGDNARSAMWTASNAPWHTYLWLTQQPERMLESVGHMDLSEAPNWHFGVTARTDVELRDACRVLSSFPSPFWVSLEPLVSVVRLPAWSCWSGVIVGCDRRAKVFCDIDWVRRIVESCHRRETPVYVKQLNIDGKVTTNMADFPRDLRVRELAWSKPEERK